MEVMFMRKIQVAPALALASSLILLRPLSLRAEAVLGKAAPDFSLPASDGKTVHLADSRGKVVVLEWYNRRCPFVRKQYGSGNMQRLQQRYTQKGVVWYSICSSAPGKQGYMTAPEAQSDRIKSHVKSTATLLDLDGRVGHLYGAKTTPHMFIIDSQGTLVYKGAIDDHPSTDVSDIPQSKNYVSAALDQVLSGKPVSAPYTDSYGCSVKYK
jgi:peroxiredoxin